MKQQLLKNLRLRAVMLVAMLCAAVSGAWAEEVTKAVTLSNGQFDTDHITWTLDNVITITQAKGTSSNAVNSSYISSPRFYAGHVISFEAASGVTLSSIVISGPTGTGSNSISKFGSNEGWTIDSNAGTATWSGSASSASITPGAQVRPTGITITYSTSGGGTPSVQTVATPTFNPAAGAVTAGTKITISSGTDGATIYYTTNGDEPTTSSTQGNTVTINAATTIKAIAVKEGMNDSEVATADYTIKEVVSGYTIDFESDLEDYVDWTFTNIGTSNTAITAHGGSKYGANINGSGNGVATCSFETKEIIALPGTFTCYVSKVSNNTTSSTWTLAVSEDGTNWATVATQEAAVNITKGTWTEFTANLSGYSDVYVRLSYGNSSAIRAIDDINITMRDPNAKTTPTVTIDATSLTTDIAGSTNVTAGTITATVTSGENTISTPAVTWSSSNTAVATVNETTGAVTLIAVGTTTITASFAGNDDYNEASNTYELTVTNSLAPGGEANPYTVAQALTAIQALPNNNATTEHYYISGIVSAFYGTATGITSSSSKRYYISDDGTTNTQLLVYSGKGLNNVAFESDDDLLIGDRVTICGAIQNYQGNTPEIASGNYIVSRVTKADNNIAATGAISLSMANPETTADVNNYISSSSDGALSFESDNTSIVTVDANGIVTPIAAGTTTITVSQAATATYKAGSTSVTVIVAPATKTDNEIVLDNESGSTIYGTPLEVAYIVEDGYDGTMTYTIENDAITDVAIGADAITFTPKAVGSTVITISAPETATFNAADDVTFTLTVTAPDGQSMAYVSTPTTVFEETFANSTGTNNDFGTSTSSDGNGTFTADSGNEWDVANAYGANGAAKFGASKKEGSATTPSITTTVGTTYRLTFKAAPWASESTTMTVTITGGTIDDENSVETSSMNTGEWNEFSYDIVASSTSMTIAFTASKNRFFLDEVKVTKPGTPLTATLNASGYATYCSLYPLDFSAATDYSAWQITNIDSDNKITFTQVTGSVKGGTGLLLKGTADETITLTSANSDNALSDNKLVGTLAPTNITNGQYYGLSGNTFVKVNAGTVKAGKALLPANLINESAGAKAFTFVFETVDGIKTVEHVSAEEAAEIFNLAGQRLQKAQRGVNIINGKKVLVK